jgi:HEPN domain-containing protein
MNAEEKFEYWLEHAQYDMKAAEAMLNAEMWLYGVFMCQQAIEKLVKGVYGLFIDTDNAPRIHNITRLVKEFEHKLEESVKDEFYDLFDTLSGYYLNNRYPDFKMGLIKTISENNAQEIYRQTKEVFAWLQTLKP